MSGVNLFCILTYFLDENAIIQWISYERCTLDEYYPTLAISNLVNMLKDNALVSIYRDVVQAIMTLFSHLGPKSHQFVEQVSSAGVVKKIFSLHRSSLK